MKNKSVLVVEDDLDIRDCLRNVLEMDGYEVQEAEHGEEAIEILRTSNPCLVLLDVNMPVLSGPEFLEKVKNPPPVVVMSAGRFPASFGPYLRKPIDMNELLSTVAKYCDSSAD